MSLINWGGFGNEERLERRMNSLLDSRLGTMSMPALDVTESQNSYDIHADLPGIRKEDVQVNISDDSLTFSGETKSSRTYKEGHICHSERHHGTYSRTIPVPQNVDKDKIDASFADGVLKIHMPKIKASSTKKINVN